MKNDYRSSQLLRKNIKRFRGGFVFKAHILLYHSTLGLRVIKKKKTAHHNRRQWLRGVKYSFLLLNLPGLPFDFVLKTFLTLGCKQDRSRFPQRSMPNVEEILDIWSVCPDVLLLSALLYSIKCDEIAGGGGGRPESAKCNWVIFTRKNAV